MTTKLKDGDFVQIIGTSYIGVIGESTEDGHYVETFDLGIVICQPRDLIPYVEN